MSDDRPESALHDSGPKTDRQNLLTERIRLALTRSPIILFSQDRDLQYTWIFNPYPGLTSADVLGKRDDQLFPPKDAERLTGIKRRVLETGEGAREEVRITFDTTSCFYDLTIEPLHDAENNIVGVAGAALDITARKQAEEALFASEERYRAASELLFGYVYSYRVEPNFKMALEWLSGNFEGVTGFSLHEAEVRSGWTMAINPEDRDIIRKKVRALLAGQEDVSEYRIFTKAGETRWVRDFSRPVRDETRGRVVRIYGATQDITERREAADALRGSEQRFRLLAENAADMIYRIRLTDGVYDYVSPAAITVTGYAPEEFYRNPFLLRRIVHPDWKDYFGEAWSRLLTGDVEPFYEYKIIHKTGVERWMYLRNTLIRDGEGRPVAVEGIVSDITGRKEAERELQESEERFRRLAQATVEGIIIIDKGIILDANENYAAMLGYTLEEIIGRPVDAFVAPESRELVTDQIREKREQPYESKALRKDGAIVEIEAVGKSIPWHGRQVRVTAIRDITGRKRMEEALRESEERYREIFENALDSYFLIEVTPESRFRFIQLNPAAEFMIGRLSRQVAGKYLEEALDPGLSTPLMARCRQCIESGIPLSYEDERDDSAGRFTFHTTLIPVRNESGNFYRIVGIAHDITDLKRTEAELRFTDFSINHSAEAIYWIGRDARILKVNEAACRLLGYTREEMLSLSITDIDPNFPRERWPENWEMSRKERSYTIKSSHRRKDGSVFPVEISVNFFEYEGKEYHFSCVRDMTARQRTEEKSRE
jgi:PAS domain S-box-containing protein